MCCAVTARTPWRTQLSCVRRNARNPCRESVPRDVRLGLRNGVLHREGNLLESLRLPKQITRLLACSAFMVLALTLVVIGSRAAQAGAPPQKPKSLSELLVFHFPNVVLLTQDDNALRFYDDLVKGKVVLISFMYTSCRSICPTTTANLAKVQEALGDRLGREVFMLSLSIDPDTDRPDVLKRFAEKFQAKP